MPVSLKTSRAITIDSPMSPPAWAWLERALIEQQTEAIEAFYNHYFDERGYLLCVARWGETTARMMRRKISPTGRSCMPLVRMIKFSPCIKRHGMATCFNIPKPKPRRWSSPVTACISEFPVMFDWMHNGEGFTAFFLQGLSDPYDKKYQDRTRRFIGFYMGNDPIADNYIPEHRVIKSFFNGSRGPMIRKATGIDWAGDPIEVKGRFKPGHGERNYEEMIAHFKDYNDVAGDHPLNMGVTTLAINAFMIDGEETYYTWAKEYLDAWVERTEANNGIIPTNIGLDGTIGGACDGKWYGGVYGWGFTTIVPQTGLPANRPYFLIRVHLSFGNGLLLTGDQKYVDTWRGVLEQVNANNRVENGQTLYPHMHGDDGWYDYRPDPLNIGALEIYYWSMNREDLKRIPMTGWIAFLEGQDPDYPVEALQNDLEMVRARIEKMNQDKTSTDTRMSDDMNGMNPAATDALIQLMLGGLPTGHLGHPMHCRFRYFDPARHRAGIPEDVAALVERMTHDEATLTLINTNQISPRTVVVQGGAYGEHHIVSIAGPHGVTAINEAYFTLHLRPGCGSTLTIKMNRYANRPTLTFPWDR